LTTGRASLIISLVNLSMIKNNIVVKQSNDVSTTTPAIRTQAMTVRFTGSTLTYILNKTSPYRGLAVLALSGSPIDA
jgi:hypothetical protein